MGMKLQLKNLSIIFLLLILFSCATESDIGLQPVNKVSSNLDCSLIFSDSRKSIIELNDVLIQIGITLDPSESNVSIIHIGGKEQIMKLIKSDKTGSHVNEIYANKDYKMELNYNLKYTLAGVNSKDPYYEGDCQLWHNGKHSKMNVYGLRNML